MKSLVNAVLLRRAEEQAHAELKHLAATRETHQRDAVATCECGRPIYRAKQGRCGECNQRLRDRSNAVLARRREQKRAHGHTREEVVNVVRSKYFGATSEDVAGALGVSTDAASQALVRAVRDGWLRRIERGRYGLGPKARAT